MILYIASFVIFCYVSASLFLRAHCPLWFKIAGCALVLLVSLKYEIYQWLGGAFFAPFLPRWFLLVMEAAFGALLVLCFLLVFKDLYLLGNYILARIGIPVPRHLPMGWIKGGLICIALAFGIYGTWSAVRVPDIRTITARLPNLPPALHGMNIVQLTDLHVGPILKKDWVFEVVEEVNAIDPDIIVMTGDYIDGTVEEVLDELRPLADMRAKYGIFAVTGNHEYYWNAKEWSEAIRCLGIDLLNNEHRLITVETDTLVIAGIPDAGAGRFGFEAPNIDKALANAPEAVRILLAHQPKNAKSWLEKADLMLSGHTHGGIMFFLQPLIARFNGGFVNGQYTVGDKQLYVSPGTGIWNGFSARIGVPPEITRIVLERG